MKTIKQKPFVKDFPHVGIVLSESHPEISEALLENALKRCQTLNVPEQHITVVKVPTVMEMPLAVQRFCKNINVDAVVCLGIVIAAESNFSQAVYEKTIQSFQQIMLSVDVPVVSGVLTVENEMQGRAHTEKGSEAIDNALQMISVLHQLT